VAAALVVGQLRADAGDNRRWNREYDAVEVLDA
jgi:hypothetical protein